MCYIEITYGPSSYQLYSYQHLIIFMGGCLFQSGAHHVDLRFSTEEDPYWLKEVRRSEVRYIKKWLSQYYHDMNHLSH